jgi:hypothetical protein
MIKSKKGVSAIIVTIILVVLVLVALGVVWAVINNLIGEGTEDIEISAKCLNTNVEAIAVDCTNPAACEVTLKRTGTNTDELTGVKMVFKNDTDSSGVISEPGNIEILDDKIITGVNSELTIPNKVEITVYFSDESGNDKYCSETTSFNF